LLSGYTASFPFCCLANFSAATIKFFHSAVPMFKILSVLKLSIPSAFAVASFSKQAVIELVT
jgi:hypothetical protein